ncbi:uncharacterized protein LOC123920125 isoform X1 [Trifolium pratense]|uniref:uncharacterized protein LOC123920125 isoform X1 n=1 Tax=Trifolium pratense TaxID=57577 RepID=UPI001E690A02|nr:uncharacterized protein LOC123920125 isoform X1 [Trifolium pratense]
MMKEWLAMFFLSILIYKVAGIVSRSVLGTNDAFQYARSRCKRFKMESSARSRTQIVCYTLIAAATKSFLSGREDTIGEFQLDVSLFFIRNQEYSLSLATIECLRWLMVAVYIVMISCVDCDQKPHVGYMLIVTR